MNIDSAFEHNELTREYFNLKLKEGNDQLEFMSATIDDFRNYFRPDNAKELVLVSDVVQTSVTLMKHALELNSIEVKTTSEGKESSYVYKNEFIQVLLNLIKNAKDALSCNDVKNPQINIFSICRKDKLVVEVCDNAGGIKEEIMEKIFEPYYSTKDEKHGTGLGLYMSKMIIEEHLEGKLSVRNSKEGACFTIEI